MEVSEGPSAPDAVDAATPEGALEEVWQALRNHYPMLEYAGAIGDAWLEEFRPRVRAAADLTAAWPIIDEMVLRLQDYHTSLRPPIPLPVYTSPDVRMGWVEGGLAILDAGPETGLVPGDRVLAVDGMAAPQALESVWHRSQGSTREAHQRSACAILLRGAPGTALRIQTECGETVLQRPDRPAAPPPVAPPVSLRPLAGGDAGLLRVAAWGGGMEAEAFTALLDAALEEARGFAQLVIDVRGNPGGRDDLADACTGRFIQRTVISSISFWREPGTETYRRSVEYCLPRGPWRYAGRVAVLIDEGCASACEHFVSGMAASGTACLVGVPTNGACGWIRRIDLRCGASLFCSMSFPLHGGMPSPLHGIEPHYRVPPRLDDLRAGRDGSLQVALGWLRSGQPLPAGRNRTWTTEAC